MQSSFRSFLTCLFLIIEHVTLGATLVSPREFTDVFAPDGTLVPFQVLPSRYQQVYRSSEFGDFGGKGMWISQIAFRKYFPIEVSARAIMEFRLTTTFKAPDELELALDKNVGANVARVWGPALRMLTQTSEPSCASVKCFQYDFPLDTPFYYEPAKGHLLMEVYNYEFQGDPFNELAQANMSCAEGDGSSKAQALLSEPATAQTNSCALVTRFSFAPYAPTFVRGSSKLLGDGAFEIQLTGVRDHSIIFERSADFTSWQPVSTNQVERQDITLRDPTPDRVRSFYRVVVPD